MNSGRRGDCAYCHTTASGRPSAADGTRGLLSITQPGDGGHSSRATHSGIFHEPACRSIFCAVVIVPPLPSSTGSPEGLLNGPQINPEGKADVMQDQGEVDDLLASLGF